MSVWSEALIITPIPFLNRITDSLGAQGTVCGGGRYDGLVELLGGKPTPGVGFALGMERLIEMCTQVKDQPSDRDHAPFVHYPSV